MLDFGNLSPKYKFNDNTVQFCFAYCSLDLMRKIYKMDFTYPILSHFLLNKIQRKRGKGQSGFEESKRIALRKF